ncbi:MAG: hypothetical protein KGH72_03275 [Candidatus Micrarchaeota archaeon]|nr:hypothetical protein [Candidatus Micrarchaeota archaeon]
MAAGRDIGAALGMLPFGTTSLRFFERFEVQPSLEINGSKPFHLVQGELIVGDLKGQLLGDVRQQTYVEFRMPGARTREMESAPVPVEGRSLASILEMMPPSAVGFRLFDRFETGHGSGRAMSARINETGIFYPGGRIMDIEDVRREEPEATALIAKMEDGDIPMMVEARQVGTARPARHTFYGRDFVFSEERLRELRPALRLL